MHGIQSYRALPRIDFRRFSGSDLLLYSGEKAKQRRNYSEHPDYFLAHWLKITLLEVSVVFNMGEIPTRFYFLTRIEKEMHIFKEFIGLDDDLFSPIPIL